MTVAGDAFGRALYDAWLGRGRGYHIIEREDGLLDAMESNAYFRPPAAWEPFERQALRYARGRVLDIGCGAGRHALYLQQRHLHVLGIDISPLAVRVARARGLRRAKVALAARIPLSWGPFGTILMLGNNFGLLENRVRGRRLLRHLFKMTTAQGRILAGERDPYLRAPAEHRRYLFFNDTGTTEIYPLSLHDALPISDARARRARRPCVVARPRGGRVTTQGRRA